MRFLLPLLLLIAPLVVAAPSTLMLEVDSENTLPVGIDVDLLSEDDRSDKVDVIITLATPLDGEPGEDLGIEGVLELWMLGELVGEVPVIRTDDWGTSTFRFRLSRALLPEAEFYLSCYFMDDSITLGGVEIVRIQLGGFPISASSTETR